MPFVTPAAEAAQTPASTPAPVATPPAASAPEPAPAAPAPPSQSAQWAALTRKEAAAVAAQQEAKALKAAAEADKAEAAKLRQESVDWAAAFKKDPIGTLSKTGLTYSQLTDIAMNDGKIPVEHQLAEVKSELSSWKQQHEDAAKKAAQDQRDAELAREQAAVAAAEQGLRDRITELTGNTEQYPLINQFGSQELVYATIDRNFRETGKIMAEVDAAQLVEAHHRKQVEEAYARIAPKPVTAPPQANKFQSKPPAPALTNRVASPSTSSARQSNKVDDRIKAARIKYGF